MAFPAKRFVFFAPVRRLLAPRKLDANGLIIAPTTLAIAVRYTISQALSSTIILPARFCVSILARDTFLAVFCSVSIFANKTFIRIGRYFRFCQKASFHIIRIAFPVHAINRVSFFAKLASGTAIIVSFAMVCFAFDTFTVLINIRSFFANLAFIRVVEIIFYTIFH